MNTVQKSSPSPGRTTDAQATGFATGQLIFGLLLSLLGSGAFAALWDAVKDKGRDTTAFDHSLLLWMHAHATPWATTAARGLAWMGSPPIIVSLAALAALLGLLWRRVRGAAWTLPLAVLGAGIIIQGVKMEFRRPRPSFFTPLLHETGYSFPSGHSLISIVVYGLLGYFALNLVKSHAGRLAVRVVTASLIIAIGVSRVYVGVHYPTDVLAGWSAGLPWLITCIGLHEILVRRWPAAGEPVLPNAPKNPMAQAALKPKP